MRTPNFQRNNHVRWLLALGCKAVSAHTDSVHRFKHLVKLPGTHGVTPALAGGIKARHDCDKQAASSKATCRHQER